MFQAPLAIRFGLDSSFYLISGMTIQILLTFILYADKGRQSKNLNPIFSLDAPLVINSFHKPLGSKEMTLHTIKEKIYIWTGNNLTSRV